MALVNTYLTQADVERETDKALLVRISNGVTGFHDRQVWLPKSQVTWVAQGCFHDTIHVPAWLARKIPTPNL
jgi:hypothetical protein